MGINIAIDAEVAYRRERLAQHYRPWRRVGAERRTQSRNTTREVAAESASVTTAFR